MDCNFILSLGFRILIQWIARKIPRKIPQKLTCALKAVGRYSFLTTALHELCQKEFGPKDRSYRNSRGA